MDDAYSDQLVIRNRELAFELGAMRRQRDALAAHVEQLQRVIRNVSTSASQATWTILHDALKETPQTSLARIKAQWQAEAIEKAAQDLHYVQGLSRPARDWLAHRANNLRRQAEGE